MANNYFFQTYFPLIADVVCFFVWFSMPSKTLTFKEHRRWLYFFFVTINFFEAIVTRSFVEIYTSPLKTLFYFLQFTLYVFLAYKENKIQKLITTILCLVAMTLADMVSVIVLSSFEIDYSEAILGIPVNFFTGLSAAFFSFALMFVISLIYNKIRHKQITNKMWQFQLILISQLLFMLTACFSVLKNGSSLESTVMKTPGYAIMFFITIAVSIAGDVCLYKILLTNSQNFELKNQLEILRTKNELELKYYEKLRKNIAETRKLNHDFSNILAVVESMVASDSSANNQALALDIIAEIKETLQKSKVKYFCENELVNLIVINKSEEIEQTGADFSANLYIPQNIGINNLDLCRIFTNLLDNAREACENNQDKQNAFVVLTAIVNENTLNITCENYCDSQIKLKGEKLISTKENHRGLGTEIINEIAKTYGGNYTYSIRDSIFSSTISLDIN